MLKHSQTYLRNSSESNNSRYNKRLSSCSRTELSQLHEKNLQMLNNSAILQKLSDKGAKLRETNELIEALLIDEKTATAQDTITVDNTQTTSHCPLTRKLEAMSLLTARQGARKKSVDLANQQALYHNHLPKRLLKIKRNHHHPIELEKAKARMLTMDESLKLQISNHEDTFDVNNPSLHLLKSLNLSVSQIPQNDNNQEYVLPLEEEQEQESIHYNHDPMIVD
ncbi:hypothetical protein G6F26_008732 [Rhizopus arrhizus]|uniref:Uncharacterized protein n=1 Tax=Rhizopus oryzae TaxID=64495 RepID=A0A9P6X7C4_RHIOR|nr:hypothetical protein G6F23_005275 [Rhizopus arrhizus]KAG1421062.1 hypothetical protein G6F58_003913 [Rhizopus delemar]KAG0761811.1 hypothetical protein G6F24_007281 [Rhizopus arrhizus]KAG0810256.1 hypothetical protein G6F20_008112 [Rhizopus arrhizus]KAG0895076.1 hypothetical protein G6F34_008551 [Rhizopus arrhizus]